LLTLKTCSMSTKVVCFSFMTPSNSNWRVTKPLKSIIIVVRTVQIYRSQGEFEESNLCLLHKKNIPSSLMVKPDIIEMGNDHKFCQVSTKGFF